MRPVGSEESDVHETDSTVAKTVVGVLVLLSNVDSVSRELPGIEVSIDAQDQDGARYGDAFTACASHRRQRGKSASHSPARYVPAFDSWNYLARPDNAGRTSPPFVNALIA